MIRQRGVTLIEMMLVIAIMAVIAAASIGALHKQAERTRINKVAMEMQQVLEAALAYHVDHHEWPPAKNTPDCDVSETTQEFVENYLPNQSIKSSMGSCFAWSYQVSPDHETDAKTARLFWIALTAPQGNVQLAKQLVSQLPNAAVTSDLQQLSPCDGNDCYVRIQIAQPAASSNSAAKNGLVIATGDCPSHNDDQNLEIDSDCQRVPSQDGTQYEISFSACPSGTRPKVTAFPNFISYPKDGWPGYTVKDIDAKRTNEPCTETVDENNQDRIQHCRVVVHASYCAGAGPFSCYYIDVAHARNPGSIGASYVVSCLPIAK